MALIVSQWVDMDWFWLNAGQMLASRCTLSRLSADVSGLQKVRDAVLITQSMIAELRNHSAQGPKHEMQPHV
jgi:hypothetical protein